MSIWEEPLNPKAEMSEYPIPEDLRVDYEWACRCADIDGDSRTEKLFIERIAKQDAEALELKDRLRQMTECRDDLNRLVASKDEEIERLKEEIGGFSNLNALRQAMIDTADENAALKKQVERLTLALAMASEERNLRQQKLDDLAECEPNPISYCTPETYLDRARREIECKARFASRAEKEKP